MRIDDGTKREILARTDIGGFIGNYVALRKRGNDLVGLCPFHGEKTPSFHVHPDRGFFKCFGCGAGGDVIAFYQQLENLTFPEALRLLAKRAGVELEPENPGAARVRNEKEAIYAANELAAAFFHRTLKLAPEGAIAREYCARRGLSAETIDRFKLGYALPEWDALVRELQAAGIALELAAKAGLVKAGQRGFYDFYRGRLMIPTNSTTGEVVAFGGRALDDSEPKYLNTSTTPVYTKGRGLYALDRARRAAAERESLIVVEGYLDCIALQQAGFSNAVASLGTAFTPEQAAELRKYAERIYLCFDADAAGSAATSKSVDALIAVGCSARIVKLPAGEDPDLFVRANGPEAFAALLADATTGAQYKIDLEIDSGRFTADSPAQAARNAERYVQTLPREEWDRWRVYIAGRLGISADDLRSSRFLADRSNFAPRTGVTSFTRHAAPAASAPGIERDILMTLLDEPSLVLEYADRIPVAVFKNERYRHVYGVLVARAGELVRTSDAFAAVGDDAEAGELLAGLQGADRSSKVRFIDSQSRRLHLDRIVERLEETKDQSRKKELSAHIDRLLEAGLPVPQAEKDEFDRLVEKLERAARRRLGTRQS